MHAVKIIGIIVLSAYLIFEGLLALAGVTIPNILQDIVGLIGIAAGVLLLISLKHN
jgi:hypothetical protein